LNLKHRNHFVSPEPIANEFVLARHPQGIPVASDFTRSSRALSELEEGSVRVQTQVWGIDPGLRSRLSGVASYVQPLALGDTVTGFVAGRVLQSRDAGFAVGDTVTGAWGWRDIADVPARSLSRAPEREGLPLESLLGLLGIPGITAYFGMLDIAQVKAGDQVLVTSAAGGVGTIASQIARLQGARVVGLAGGAVKCQWLLDSAGLDDVIDYKATPDLAAALDAKFPLGIDVVFENLGNAMLDTVLPKMRIGGRIVVCGQTADYNLPPEQVHGIRNTRAVIAQRLRIQGLVAMDYAARYEEARRDIRAWAREGRLVTREHISIGFEQLPAAFASLFAANSLGRKLVVAA